MKKLSPFPTPLLNPRVDRLHFFLKHVQKAMIYRASSRLPFFVVFNVGKAKHLPECVKNASLLQPKVTPMKHNYNSINHCNIDLTSLNLGCTPLPPMIVLAYYPITQRCQIGNKLEKIYSNL